MDRDELMQLAAETAVRELEWESIEFLFKPTTQLELLLRIDFDGTRKAITAWIADDAPDAMPFRFRGPYAAQMRRAIDVERFYRTCKREIDSMTAMDTDDMRCEK